MALFRNVGFVFYAMSESTREESRVLSDFGTNGA
jgi:hypothetical protein